MDENELSKIIVDCCYKIHTKLGAGLFESVYEEILCYELAKHKIRFQKQKTIPVVYDNIKFDIGFRADVIAEENVIIEIKSIEQLAPVHHKQLLTYLKLTNLKLGLLVNFNVNLIKDGIKRMVSPFAS
jgi:GxxExxY protein